MWEDLQHAARFIRDPRNHPRVFRLFMKRRSPRHVIGAVEITQVWRDERGKTIRWTETGYLSMKDPSRKGGNAFIRGDVEFVFSDAWWMARELTDLRLLLAEAGDQIQVAAWCSRGSDLTDRHGTNGDVWPVHLLIGEPNVNQSAGHAGRGTGPAIHAVIGS